MEDIHRLHINKYTVYSRYWWRRGIVFVREITCIVTYCIASIPRMQGFTGTQRRRAHLHMGDLGPSCPNPIIVIQTFLTEAPIHSCEPQFAPQCILVRDFSTLTIVTLGPLGNCFKFQCFSSQLVQRKMTVLGAEQVQIFMRLEKEALSKRHYLLPQNREHESPRSSVASWSSSQRKLA